MGVTVGQLIGKVQRRINGGRRAEVNRLTGAMTDNQDTLNFEFDAGGIVEGAYIAVDDEIMRVWDVSGLTATVQRGELGTDPVAHDDGDIVEVSARFFRADVREAITEELVALGPDLFTVDFATVPIGRDVRGYDSGIPTDSYGVVNVQLLPEGQDLSASFSRPEYQVSRVPTSLRASGWNINLLNTYSSARSLYVTYAKPFVTTNLSDDVDLEATVELPRRMHDIVIYGALWRLLAGDEAERSDTGIAEQFGRTEDVPPGYRLQAAEGYRRIRQQFYSREVANLRGLYPYRAF